MAFMDRGIRLQIHALLEYVIMDCESETPNVKRVLERAKKAKKLNFECTPIDEDANDVSEIPDDLGDNAIPPDKQGVDVTRQVPHPDNSALFVQTAIGEPLLDFKSDGRIFVRGEQHPDGDECRAVVDAFMEFLCTGKFSGSGDGSE